MKGFKRNWTTFAIIFLGIVLLVSSALLLYQWLQERSSQKAVEQNNPPDEMNAPISGRTTLIVGGDDSYPPYSFLEDGVAEGFDNDVVRSVAKVMGVEVEFRLTSWEEAQQNLLDGKVDLINGMAYSTSRENFFDFANPHSLHYFDVFVCNNSKINTIEDLQGKEVVVEEGDIMQEYLTENNFSGKVIAVNNPAEALHQVSSGKYSAAFLNKVVGYYFINTSKIKNMHSLNLQILEQKSGFAVQKGNLQLVRELNEALAIMDATGEYDRLSNKWFAVYQQQSLLYQLRYYLYGLAVFAALFILAILWVWLLRRLVNRQTQKLQESEEKYRRLIDSATEGVGVVVDNKLVYLNPEATSILGFTGKPIYPLDVRLFLPPEDYQTVVDQIRNNVERGNESGLILCRIIRENGEIRWIKSQYRKIIWDSASAFLGVFSDITEARLLEETVKDNEKKFRLLFEKTPVGLFYFNTDLIITNANDHLMQLLKLSDEDMNKFDLHTVKDKKILPAISSVLKHQEGSYTGVFHPSKAENEDELFINLRTTPLFDEKQELQGGIGLIEDITQSMKDKNQLHFLEDRFSRTFYTSPDSININRLEDGLYLDINQGFTDLTGYTHNDVTGKTSVDLEIWAKSEDRERMLKELQDHGEVKNLEAEFRLKNGKIKTGLMSASMIEVNGEKCVISITRDISDRKRSENAIRESEHRYRSIFESVPVSIWEEDFLKVYDMLEELRKSGVTDLEQYLEKHPGFVRNAIKTIIVKDINAATIQMFEAQNKEELMGSIDRFFDQASYKGFQRELQAIWNHKTSYEGETVNRTLDGKRMIVRISINIPEKREDFSRVLVSLNDITQRIEAEAALRESENRYKNIFNSVPVSIWEEDFSQVSNLLNDLRENGVKDLDTYLRQHPQAIRDAVSMITVNEVNDATLSIYGASSKMEMMQSLTNIFTDEAYDTYRRILIAFWNKQPSFYGETTNRTMDGREIDISISTNFPHETEDYSRVFISMEDITERKKAEDQIRRQVKHLASLRAVDMAISASIDLPITLRVLINQAVQQLSVDAAAIFLFNPKIQMLEYAAGSGFTTRAIEDARLHLGQSYAGKAALNKRMVAASDLGTQYSQITIMDVRKEGFSDYIGVPLIAKGKVKGVLELFNRTALSTTTEWMSLLDSMAGQAAIAIDNATLFDEVQQANINLRQAYDATIEGWARALELRDGETKGHSARVADMTVRLAQAFKIKGDALVDIRRGALLHDIGKMGIPDNILLKKDKLTDAEWQIMRRHPDYANNLLGSIDFLKAAIEIPYAHHEKWDGSGYPRGLKGEEIPLASRIFAVIDCWDALRSDRPYRAAWTNLETWNHIEKNSGIEYDPKVVEKFHSLLISLKLIQE